MAPTEEPVASAISHRSVTRAQHNLNTPPESFPRASTPPPVSTEKRRMESHTGSIRGHERSRSMGGESSVDAAALNKALMREFDEPRSRDITPGGSPSRKRQRVYGDR